MAKNKNNKKLKQTSVTKTPPDTRNPRFPAQFAGAGKSNFKWRIHPNYIDFDHEKYGWNKVGLPKFFEILFKFLHLYEDMEWCDVEGRNSCHSWKIEDIPPDAQKRLKEKYSGKVGDTLYQVDIGEYPRIIGFRDRSIFYIMWYDAHHEFSPIK